MPEVWYVSRTHMIDDPFRPVRDEIINGSQFSTHIKSLPGYKKLSITMFYLVFLCVTLSNKN
jgi:hypothetical protein